MIFNSFQFIWLFPLIFIVYWAIDYFGAARLRKLPQYFLLIVSYGLYMQWNPAYALILFYVTLSTWGFARIIQIRRDRQKSNWKFLTVTAAVILALLPLLIFKYYNFITQAGASALANIGIDTSPPGLSWVVPLGLSFYTFQALGYLWDVYYKKIEAERNFGDYMLFVAFFPQILCGPISTAKDLLPQIKNPKRFDNYEAVKGLRLILWGMLLKVVLADRIGIYVDTVYKDYEHFSGSTCMFAAVLYSFQIYGDFAGYSYMAVGVAKLLGFDLIYNFIRPYFATSVSQFWKRWNRSLTIWLTSYIYIPLGGSRKGKFRTYLNIIITFLVSGIWHGANYTFIFWGLIHGAAQCIEKFFGLNRTTKFNALSLVRILITFLVVTVAWIFFRMPTIEEGFELIGRIFTSWSSFFINYEVLAHLVIAFLLVLPIEILLEYRNIQFKRFLSRHVVIRWAGYLILTVSLLLFGVLDSSQFIYINF